jgi:hypothetical protein
MPNQSNTDLLNNRNQQVYSVSNQVPLSFFKSGQFLSLTNDCQGGIILQKRFYADFAGPGAAFGSSFDVDCTSVYVIGAVKFSALSIYSDRQQAFKKRMAYCDRLQKITRLEDPLKRAFSILEQLYHWVGAQETEKIPDELVAMLAGLLPQTIELVKKNYPQRYSQALILGEKNALSSTIRGHRHTSKQLKS